MKINNHSNTLKAKIFLVRIPLILVLTLLVLQLLEVINQPTLLISSVSLFVLAIGSTLILRMHYVEFDFQSDELSIKYYSVFPLIREYQRIEIKKGDLAQFEIIGKMGGWIPVLILTIHSGGGLANFPEIPLSILSDSDQQLLSNQLKDFN